MIIDFAWWHPGAVLIVIGINILCFIQAIPDRLASFDTTRLMGILLLCCGFNYLVFGFIARWLP